MNMGWSWNWQKCVRASYHVTSAMLPWTSTGKLQKSSEETCLFCNRDHTEQHVEQSQVSSYCEVRWVAIPGLSPIRRQAIISTNAGLLSIGPLRTNFSEILMNIQKLSFTKTHLKLPSAKWRPFCPGGDELKENWMGLLQSAEYIWWKKAILEYRILISVCRFVQCAVYLLAHI